MLKAIDSVMMRAVAALANLGAQLRNERGQDLMEYALLSGLVAVALGGLLAAGILTGAVNTMANGIAECIDFDNVCP